MMDYQTYATREAARTARAAMRGWNTRVVRLYLPDDRHASRKGYAWVVEVRGYGDPLYMRTTGYVR